MTWKSLNSVEQLQMIQESNEITIIFKHSIRCPVSGMAKRSLEQDQILIPENTVIYYLDLINYRDISNAIADMWQVKHESPQVLVIKGNQCLYHASHSDIEMRDLIHFIS